MIKLKIGQYFFPHILIGIFTFVLFFAVTELITVLVKKNQLERTHSSIVDKTATLRAKIEGELNSMLFLSAGLMAHVATHPEIGETEFGQIASEIITRGRNIRNIGLAKNNIITHIFPLAGNEVALGLAYEDLPLQWPAVKRAIELSDTVIAGPVDLIQGGSAFVFRTPIYTTSGITGFLENHKPSYWGIASLVISAPGFFKSADFNEFIDDTYFAVRGKNGLGNQGDIIIGDPRIFLSDAIVSTIKIPNGTWQIAAIPSSGWQINNGFLWSIRISGWLIGLLFAVLLTTLSISRKLNRDMAFHDHLTKLPNRRLLEDRVSQILALSIRTKTSFGLFNIDLDDFKEINDSYGHKVGDGLLIEASKRMLASVRTTDTVARTGGDEFIILVYNLHKDAEMLNIRLQLEKNLISTTCIEGKNIQITASIGYAIFPDDGDTVEKVKNKADERMYAEKIKKQSPKAIDE